MPTKLLKDPNKNAVNSNSKFKPNNPAFLDLTLFEKEHSLLRLPSVSWRGDMPMNALPTRDLIGAQG